MSKSKLSQLYNQQTCASHVISAFIRLSLNIDDRATFLDLLRSEKIKPTIFLQQLQNHKCYEIILHTIKSHKLRNTLPRITKRIEVITQRRQTHNEELWNECITFAKELTNQSIPYVLYKGKAFAHQFYPSIRLRHSVDIDIGMALEDIPKAAAILRSQGYEEHKGSIDYNNISQSRAYHIDFSYVKRDTQGKILYNIELHWTTAHHVLNIDYGFDQLLAKREELLLGKNLIYTLPKIEQAIIMVIHHGMVDVWGKIRHLIDLHYVVEQLDEAEMDLFISKLKELKLHRCYNQGLQLLAILKNEQEPNEHWTHILSGDMGKNWSEFPKKIWWHLKQRESNRERIRVIYQMLRFKIKFGNSIS